MADETNTIEIEAPKAEAPAAPVPPKADELKEKGWTSDEIDRATKRGMVSTPEVEAKRKADEDAAKAKSDGEAKAKADADAKAKAEEDAKKGTPKRRDDDRNHLSPISDVQLTPEQEKVFKETFGPKSAPFGLYVGYKNQVRAKQELQRKLDEAEKARTAAEERAKALESGKLPIRKLVDEDGNEVDPDDLPLTPKRLREIQKMEAEQRQRDQEEFDSKAKTLSEAHVSQEEHCREIYPDFDKATELTSDLIKNLDKLVTDPAKKAKIRNLAHQMKFAALNADKIDLDEYHAAQIAYELGQMHPDYGSDAEPAKNNGDASENDGDLKDPKKGDGTLTPEQMKRIEKNTQRGISSASVSGGGGKRKITADEMDAGTLVKLPYSERQRFKQKFPSRYTEILRGK